jgi:glycerol uptake facilitator-like aquaporin
MESTAKAAIAEFVGTFALIFFAAGTTIATGNGDLLAIALANGLTIAIMVSCMAHISGGVFNPAIQIALWVTGKMPTWRSGVYIAAQVAGAVAAAALLPFFSGYALGKAVLVEAVATFFLVWVVFATAIDDRGPSVRAGAFTIGLVITIDVLAIGVLTGGAMNPARWFGPALISGTWSDWWVWIVGPIAGAIIAGVAYWYVFLQGKEPATP